MTLLEQEILKSADNIQNNILEYDLKVGLALAEAYTKMNILKEYCEDESSLDVFSVVKEYSVYCEASEDDDDSENNGGEKSTLSKALEIPKRLIQALINFIHKILDNLDFDGLKKKGEEAANTLEQTDEETKRIATERMDALIEKIIEENTTDGKFDDDRLKAAIASATQNISETECDAYIEEYMKYGRIAGATIATGVNIGAVYYVAKQLGIIDDFNKMNRNISHIFSNKINLGVNVDLLSERIGKTHDLAKKVYASRHNEIDITREINVGSDLTNDTFEKSLNEIKAINYIDSSIEYDLKEFLDTRLGALETARDNLQKIGESMKSTVNANVNYGQTNQDEIVTIFSDFWNNVYRILNKIYPERNISQDPNNISSGLRRSLAQAFRKKGNAIFRLLKNEKTTFYDVWLRDLISNNKGEYNKDSCKNFINSIINRLEAFRDNQDNDPTLLIARYGNEVVIKPDADKVNTLLTNMAFSTGKNNPVNQMINELNGLIKRIDERLTSQTDTLRNQYDATSRGRNATENREGLQNVQSSLNAINSIYKDIARIIETDSNTVNSCATRANKSFSTVGKCVRAIAEGRKTAALAGVKTFGMNRAIGAAGDLYDAVNNSVGKAIHTGSNIVGNTFDDWNNTLSRK